MVRLEIGPGYSRSLSSRCYRFNPRYHPDYDVVYLDLRAPDFRCERCSWIVADAQRLPFRSCSVDEIYAAHVIEHLEDPLQFLKECARVLRRGGTVTIETPNFLSRNAYADPDHRHVFDFVTLMKLFRRAGLVPHFASPNIGSLLPRWLRRFLKLFLLILADTLVVVGEKV